MKTMLNLFLVSILTMSVGTLNAASLNEYDNSVEKAKAVKTLNKSIDAFENVMDDPNCSIPHSLIDQSEGIVIFPGAFKIAIGAWGGQAGRGIAMIRKEDGTWSNPFFVTLGEGSLGLQIGAQSSEIVLLFKHRYDIIEIDEAEIILGSDIGVAAGPVSNGSASDTDIKFEREIYSYCRSKGLFAGVSLAGGILSYNEMVTESLYGVYGIDATEIFNGIETPFNDDVDELIETLNMFNE
ncbi:lipid-binding SYLF domain-containing protein [Bacteroidota bacterium]